MRPLGSSRAMLEPESLGRATGDATGATSPLESMPVREQGSPAGTDVSEMNLGDLVAIVARHWKILPMVLALTLALAGVYVLVTPPRYAATMSMLIDNRERGAVGADMSPVRNSDPGLVESEMRFLTSNEVLRRVVEKEKLRQDPEFSGKGSFSIMGAIKSALFGRSAEGPSDEQIIEALSKLIAVKRSEKSYVIDVEVMASTPEKAEALARALSAAYFDTHSKLSDERARSEARWLDEKLADLRGRLETAEREVDAYRRSKRIVVSDGRLPLEEQLKQASAALVEAHGKRSEAEARYLQLVAAAKTGAVESLNDAIKSPLIEKLRADLASLARDAAYAQSVLGPRHPSYLSVQTQMVAMRGQVQQELHRIAAAQKRDLDAVRKAEEDARDLVTELQNTIGNIGGDRIELGERERIAASLRAQYEKTLVARESIQRETLATSNGVVINRPFAPKTKVSPKTLPALIIAIAAGVNLWIIAAVGLEFIGRRRAPRVLPDKGLARTDPEETAAREVERPAPAPSSVSLTLPVFEVSASAVWREDDAGTIVRAQDAMKARGSAFRAAVARIFEALLRWEPMRSGAPVIAVMGRRAGAGVSTVSLSLALFASARGERVLLIDANKRRPTLTALLPASMRDPLASSKPHPWRRDETSGGEILAVRLDTARAPWARNRYAASKAALVILDLGTMRPDELAPDLAEIDAAVCVEADEAGGETVRLFFAPGESPLVKPRQSVEPAGAFSGAA